jgi:hypothetical protein
VGFNDHRQYGFREAEILIDGLKARGFSVLLGVPTNWRQQKKLPDVDFSTAGENVADDTLYDPALPRLIKKCDIVMPWFVGRFRENNLSAMQKIVEGDIQWCKANAVDYAPLAYPGFSWLNMDKNSRPIPRNRGSFYWKQLANHINQGAEMLYLAMFDEIDEGTAIFKCATEVPVGASYFLPLDADLGNDYYLFLAGEAAKALKSPHPKLDTQIPQRKKQAQNPFITHIYTADPSAHVWNDGRLYIYASHDISPARGCDLMDEYHVFSTDDMVNWTDHGEILRASQVPWGKPLNDDGKFMWAPDCVYKDGIYYFYFPHPSEDPWNETWKIGVATSKEPAKDFTVIGYVKGMLAHIDPCVFIDDDGQAYIYQGGGGTCLGGKLKDNMLEVDGELQAMQGLDDFHEATWIHKYKGKYYLSYSDNHDEQNSRDGIKGNNRMRYAIGDTPLGPWKYMGIYMKPTNSYTNHGSIVEYKGQWYAFYHNSVLSERNGELNDWLRSICVDKLYYNPDGTIQTVIQNDKPDF